MMKSDLEYRENVDTADPAEPKHGKRVYVYFTLLVFAVLMLYAVKSQWQDHVPVKQVTVEGISVITKDEIVRLMKLPPNVPMYAVDLTAVQRNILSNSFVKNVVLQRDAPSTIRVIVEERVPSAIVVAKEMFYIAADGTLLPFVASTETYDIPVISGLDSLAGLRAGQKLISADVNEALEIINAAQATGPELYHSISEIRLRKGKDLVLYSFDAGVPIIFGKGDAVKKMVKLDAFRKTFLRNGDSKEIRYIDLRFDDQVVVSGNS